MAVNGLMWLWGCAWSGTYLQTHAYEVHGETIPGGIGAPLCYCTVALP